jgi:hypothetical protein
MKTVFYFLAWWANEAYHRFLNRFADLDDLLLNVGMSTILGGLFIALILALTHNTFVPMVVWGIYAAAWACVGAWRGFVLPAWYRYNAAKARLIAELKKEYK